MSASRALATSGPGVTVTTLEDLQRLAKMMVASGFFEDAADLARACVIIQAGQELGVPPVAALRGISIIRGKLVPEANLTLALARQRTGLEYETVEHTDEVCRIRWSRAGKTLGETAFTLADARKAGLLRPGSGWERYPSDMLWARASSRGVRRYAPDATLGSVYAPGELDDPAPAPEPAVPTTATEAREVAPDPDPEPDPIDGLIADFEAATTDGTLPAWIDEEDNDWRLALGDGENAVAFRAAIGQSVKAAKQQLEDAGQPGGDMRQYPPGVLRGAVMLRAYTVRNAVAFGEAADATPEPAGEPEIFPAEASAKPTAEDYESAAEGVVPSWAEEPIGGGGKMKGRRWADALAADAEDLRGWLRECIKRDENRIKREHTEDDIDVAMADPAAWGERALQARTMLRIFDAINAERLQGA